MASQTLFGVGVWSCSVRSFSDNPGYLLTAHHAPNGATDIRIEIDTMTRPQKDGDLPAWAAKLIAEALSGVLVAEALSVLAGGANG